MYFFPLIAFGYHSAKFCLLHPTDTTSSYWQHSWPFLIIPKVIRTNHKGMVVLVFFFVWWKDMAHYFVTLFLLCSVQRFGWHYKLSGEETQATEVQLRNQPNPTSNHHEKKRKKKFHLNKTLSYSGFGGEILHRVLSLEYSAISAFGRYYSWLYSREIQRHFLLALTLTGLLLASVLSMPFL